VAAKSARNAGLYPAFLNLNGVQALVVGGGPVALRKARGLLAAGASVHAVSPEFVRAFRGLAKVRFVIRRYRNSDLKGMRLVFAATSDAALNARIAADAWARGAWANVASPPEAGKLVVPSVLRRGRLCLGIGTGGASAAAARALRQELERHVDAAWGAFLDLVEARRRKLKARVTDPALRRRLLQQLGSASWVKLIRKAGKAAAGKRMDALLARAVKPGKPSGVRQAVAKR